jgi:hypothetical protein
LNYTFRMHDPRIGRFFAVDPLTKDYPFYSPYSFSGNKVIAFNELEGLEEIYYLKKQRQKYSGFDLAIKLLNKSGIMKELKMEFAHGNDKTDIYINVTEQMSRDVYGNITAHGTTDVYETGITENNKKYDKGSRITSNQLEFGRLVKKNNALNIDDVLNNTVNKDKSVIAIKLNEDDVEKASLDNERVLLNLLETIIHEIRAHAMEMKDGTYKSTEKKDHEKFYEAKSSEFNSQGTIGFKEIKPNSRIGKEIIKLEKLIKEYKIELNKKQENAKTSN